MEPVPYEIRADDIDEVLSAYEPASGWTEEQRGTLRSHVMAHVTELDEIVRTAPEREPSRDVRTSAMAQPVSARPGEASAARRELALAAIEDLLIREGLVDARADEQRVFPVITDARRTE